MTEHNRKPLLTFVVFAFEHEQLVRDAVEAALAQTYSPLEIILSDDCSRDRTFEIMKEVVAGYQGPHKIVLNRNPSNIRPARHVNRVVRLAQGQLIIASAGDDVSLPERSAKIFEAWDSTGRTATLIHSRIVHIDGTGKEIKHASWHEATEPTHRIIEQSATPFGYVKTLKPEVFGCAGAYTPSLFEIFGDLPDDVIHEDNAIALRSVLRGRILYIDTVLVKYRLHGNNLFNARHGVAMTLASVRDQEGRMQRNFANRASMYRAFGKDLSVAHDAGIIPDHEHFRATVLAREKERIFSLGSSFMISATMRKVLILFQLVRAGIEPRLLRELLFRLLPAPLFLAVKLLRGRLLNVGRRS